MGAADGVLVKADEAREALSGAELIYDDGATQTFMSDGTTTYVEAGRESSGEWGVEDDGTFTSFWPPSFRASYTLSWRVVDNVVGLTFVSQRDGSVFSGTFGSRTTP